MRSIPLLAATTVILMLATGCGDNGSGVNPPAANFDPVCTGLSCTFTDRSAEGEGAITGWAWDFGDPNSGTANTSTQQSPVHVFSAAGTYSVRLTVTDADGETNSITKSVPVTSGTTNQPPVAAFIAPTTCVAGAACLFSDGSSDPDGDVTGWSWNFGDLSAPDINQNPSHTFGAEGEYEVTLTVTDNLGATNAITQTVTIGSAAATNCTTISDTEVDCLLNITQRSTITITLTAEDCELDGNLIHIPPPGADMAQNVFTNVCHAQPVGATRTLSTETGAPLIFEAGSQLHVRLRRGTDETLPPGSPAGNITGTSPTWTINFDDGGNPGGPGEPDFTDVVLTVQSNPA